MKPCNECHRSYNDARRFPDFSYLSKKGNFDEIVDCVIITHLYVLDMRMVVHAL